MMVVFNQILQIKSAPIELSSPIIPVTELPKDEHQDDCNNQMVNLLTPWRISNKYNIADPEKTKGQ